MFWLVVREDLDLSVGRYLFRCDPQEQIRQLTPDDATFVLSDAAVPPISRPRTGQPNEPEVAEVELTDADSQLSKLRTDAPNSAD